MLDFDPKLYADIKYSDGRSIKNIYYKGKQIWPDNYSSKWDTIWIRIRSTHTDINASYGMCSAFKNFQFQSASKRWTSCDTDSAVELDPLEGKRIRAKYTVKDNTYYLTCDSSLKFYSNGYLLSKVFNSKVTGAAGWLSSNLDDNHYFKIKLEPQLTRDFDGFKFEPVLNANYFSDSVEIWLGTDDTDPRLENGPSEEELTALDSYKKFSVNTTDYPVDKSNITYMWRETEYDSMCVYPEEIYPPNVAVVVGSDNILSTTSISNKSFGKTKADVLFKDGTKATIDNWDSYTSSDTTTLWTDKVLYKFDNDNGKTYGVKVSVDVAPYNASYRPGFIFAGNKNLSWWQLSTTMATTKWAKFTFDSLDPDNPIEDIVFSMEATNNSSKHQVYAANIKLVNRNNPDLVYVAYGENESVSDAASCYTDYEQGYFNLNSKYFKSKYQSETNKGYTEVDGEYIYQYEEPAPDLAWNKIVITYNRKNIATSYSACLYSFARFLVKQGDDYKWLSLTDLMLNDTLALSVTGYLKDPISNRIRTVKAVNNNTANYNNTSYALDKMFSSGTTVINSLVGWMSNALTADTDYTIEITGDFRNFYAFGMATYYSANRQTPYTHLQFMHDEIVLAEHEFDYTDDLTKAANLYVGLDIDNNYFEMQGPPTWSDGESKGNTNTWEKYEPIYQGAIDNTVPEDYEEWKADRERWPFNVITISLNRKQVETFKNGLALGLCRFIVDKDGEDYYLIANEVTDDTISLASTEFEGQLDLTYTTDISANSKFPMSNLFTSESYTDNAGFMSNKAADDTKYAITIKGDLDGKIKGIAYMVNHTYKEAFTPYSKIELKHETKYRSYIIHSEEFDYDTMDKAFGKYVGSTIDSRIELDTMPKYHDAEGSLSEDIAIEPLEAPENNSIVGMLLNIYPITSSYWGALYDFEIEIEGKWYYAVYNATSANKNSLDYNFTYNINGKAYTVHMLATRVPWNNTMWSTVGAFMGTGNTIVGYLGDAAGTAQQIYQTFTLNFTELVDDGLSITGFKFNNSANGASYSAAGFKLWVTYETPIEDIISGGVTMKDVYTNPGNYSYELLQTWGQTDEGGTVLTAKTACEVHVENT